jgi:SNF2 family DNA or RNA helicase
MKKAVAHLVRQPSAGLFLDPGLRKTSITLKAFLELRARGEVTRLLVLAPLRPAYSVWPAEAAKWDVFEGLTVAVMHGAKKEAEFLRDDVDVHVINYDGLAWLLKVAIAHRRWPWDMLVCDESTKLKNTRTQRVKALRPFLPRFKRRVILTGTPAPRGLLDLFGQVYVMDLGRAFGPYVTHYREKFFNPTGYGGYTWVPKKGAEEQIYARLNGSVLRMSAEDHLELPPLVINDIAVDLPPAARLAYEALERDLVARINDRTVTAKNAAVATGACRQLANGGIYTGPDHDHDFEQVHEAKTEALLDLVEELDGKPLLIAYEFRHDLARLRAALPGLEVIGGGVGVKRAVALEAAWNAGELPYLALHYQSVHGLNIQSAPLSALCCYAMTWDLELYQQLLKRLHRSGRESRVVAHRLIARATVDEAQRDALDRKARGQADLFEALRAYAIRRTR